MIGQAQGLLYPQVKQVVNLYLSDDQVTVYQHQPYDRYMQIIAQCDLFINPFPFGNTNGIIDTVTCGLVGVCKTGPEVHEHIDTDFLSTFHHLLNADVLIGSKSGMSHLAGMLGKHIKIMPKMWHSYRGATQLLEVSDIQSELKPEEIKSHLQQYLRIN